jgi:glycosyltransferase involved in cell wall biosynthesis
LTRAFASATPVVASDIEGYAQVADHGETGILVPPGDSRALATAVLDLLGDEERRQALGAAARTAAEPYSWDRIAAQLVQVYERVATPAAAMRAAA